jgi:hypothetical protein
MKGTKSMAEQPRFYQQTPNLNQTVDAPLIFGRVTQEQLKTLPITPDTRTVLGRQVTEENGVQQVDVYVAGHEETTDASIGEKVENGWSGEQETKFTYQIKEDDGLVFISYILPNRK